MKIPFLLQKDAILVLDIALNENTFYVRVALIAINLPLRHQSGIFQFAKPFKGLSASEVMAEGR